MAKRGRKKGVNLMPADQRKKMAGFSLKKEHKELLNRPELGAKKSVFVRFLFDSFLDSAAKDPALIRKVGEKISKGDLK